MDVVTYALLNKKIKGLTSGVKSASVRGHSIIFELNDGSTQTMTFDQPADGISITDVDINADKHLICTMSDGTSIDAGEILTTKGDKGFSPTITENPDNTNEIYKLDVTNEGGTFTTPNLKGTGGNITVDDVLSDTSENPVQNKIVKAELDKKADKSKIPTELPANGGNADTVGGKSASDFLPFQTSSPVYKGDIKDISKMGTYSCYKEDCTNLPDILIWAYVTMMQFQDAGYKTFLCIELNPLSANQHCRNIYIAREYDVDDSGNMVWYRACDGGISETMSDWGTQTISDANNAPYGFCNTSPDSENNPDTFWTTILTVGANANSSYKQQFAFPWSEGKAVRYRMQDNEKWGSWKDIYTSDNKTYVTGIFNLTSSSTSQTIDIPLAFDPVMVLLFKQSSTIVVPKQFMLEMIDPSKYSIKIGVVDSTDLQLTTGFQASFLTVEGTGMAVRYIAYK